MSLLQASGSASGRPKLSIVFVNYDSVEYLRRALTSLQEAQPGLSTEVVVVDNASKSEEELRGLCRRFNARLLLLHRNLGYGAAANRGARVASGEYLAVSNPDVLITSGAVEALIGFLERDHRAGVVGPRLVYLDGSPQPSARRFPRLKYVLFGRRSLFARILARHTLSREFLYLDSHKARAPVEVEAVVGTFIVFRRQAYEQVGGFDESYFMFAEDVDICHRIRSNGWRAFIEPKAIVRHFYGGVRRKHSRLTEYHRIRALCRYLCQDGSFAYRVLVTVLGAGYLGLLEAGSLAGLREYERSWHTRTDS